MGPAFARTARTTRRPSTGTTPTDRYKWIALSNVTLGVLLATLAGAYSGAEALPALTLAANESRYRSLPAIASLIGWMQTAILLAINYPVGLVAYWFVLQTYPLLKKPGPAPPDSDAPMHVSRAQAELGSSSMERLSISR